MSKLPQAGRSSSPKSLSDFPTLRGVVALPPGGAVPLPTDLDRTLPMEPVVLAQLCAATQVSARRRVLPAALEYSVHVELPASPAPVTSATPPRAAPAKAFPNVRLRQQLATLLGSLVGLSLGICVAWRIDLTRSEAARRPSPPITAPAAPTPPSPAPLPAAPVLAAPAALPAAPPVEPAVAQPTPPTLPPATSQALQPRRPALPHKPAPSVSAAAEPAHGPKGPAAVRDDELLSLLPPDEPQATQELARLSSATADSR